MGWQIVEQKGEYERDRNSKPMQFRDMLSSGQDNGYSGGNRGSRKHLRAYKGGMGNPQEEDTKQRALGYVARLNPVTLPAVLLLIKSFPGYYSPGTTPPSKSAGWAISDH